MWKRKHFDERNFDGSGSTLIKAEANSEATNSIRSRKRKQKNSKGKEAEANSEA